MSTGEMLTRWTVRATLALYAATLALRLAAPARRREARALWTVGCLAFVAHVAAAFGFYHAWSHAHAYAETARQTRELFGINWGGGLYFNYAFTLAWAADAAYWWRAGIDRYERRPRWVDVSLHAFFAFMAINGAIVFARGPTRWVALAATAGLGLLGLARLGGARLRSIRLRRVRQRGDGRLG